MYDIAPEKKCKLKCDSHFLDQDMILEMDKLIINELEADEYYQETTNQIHTARLRLLKRLSGGASDPDMDAMVEAEKRIRKHLTMKIYDHAISFYQAEILNTLFEQIHTYHTLAEQCDDLAIRMEYSYEVGGLMAAAILITHAEMDDVINMYKTYLDQ